MGALQIFLLLLGTQSLWAFTLTTLAQSHGRNIGPCPQTEGDLCPRGGLIYMGLPGPSWNGLAAALVALLLLNPVRTVDPGTVGVVTTFGQVSEGYLRPGLHLVAPTSSVTPFSTKTSLIEQENFVPTKEGLTVELDTAALYHIDPNRAREIYLNLGEGFEDIIIKPELSSAVRGLTSEAEAKALYTSGRTELQRRLKEDLQEQLAPRGIEVESILLKAVKLPEQLSKSIEQKAQAEQESQRMEYVLTKERQEAERKTIEAQGIADFQRIVSDGITPGLLQWKGIEATEKLAKSDNAKVVIVGNSKDNLPVILSGEQNIRK